jgi:hypothetical protein
MFAMRKLLALVVFALAIPALAWSQMTPVPVPAPAPGSTGNQCYEDCMHHYRDFNNMVEGSTEAQCRRGCGYSPNAAPPTENASCQQRCANDYNTCMANSPDPQNDRNCPINNLQCQQTCFH